MIPKPVKKTKELFAKSNTDIVSNASVLNFAAIAIPNQISDNLQALDERVKLMMEKTQNMIQRSGKLTDGRPRQAQAFICKVCGKRTQSLILGKVSKKKSDFF